MFRGPRLPSTGTATVRGHGRRSGEPQRVGIRLVRHEAGAPDRTQRQEGLRAALEEPLGGEPGSAPPLGARADGEGLHLKHVVLRGHGSG